MSGLLPHGPNLSALRLPHFNVLGEQPGTIRLAIELATRECEMSGWENWISLRTLAVAHDESDQFDKAVRVTEKAITLAPDSEKVVLKSELKDYQSTG